MKKILKTFILMIVLINMVIINCYAEESEVVKAKVIETKEIYEEQTENMTEKIQKVEVEILEGKRQGERFEAKYCLSYDIDNKIVAYELNKGNTVIVQINEAQEDSETQVIVQDVIRQNYILYMLLAFFLLIILVGRKQGLKAILALVITVALIYMVMISSIYKGYNAILMSILTSFIIIVITFIIISGFNKKSFTAAIGTIGGVAFAGIMAFLFGVLAKLSGGQEEAIMLSISAQNMTFNFRELLFAGIVIASLGASMDVGMSIASSLDEIKQKDPNITGKELFKSGMNIGGDIIGTMTNTLILAYVGGALNLILLFMASNMNILDIINKETIASEAISAIAGSMGVIFTVPTTAFVYAFINRHKTIYKKKSDNIINGQRSLKI